METKSKVAFIMFLIIYDPRDHKMLSTGSLASVSLLVREHKTAWKLQRDLKVIFLVPDVHSLAVILHMFKVVVF